MDIHVVELFSRGLPVSGPKFVVEIGHKLAQLLAAQPPRHRNKRNSEGSEIVRI